MKQLIDFIYEPWIEFCKPEQIKEGSPADSSAAERCSDGAEVRLSDRRGIDLYLICCSDRRIMYLFRKK
jgi:hypothetical protein